jgi:dTDP-4-dehydrorhamnose reductase
MKLLIIGTGGQLGEKIAEKALLESNEVHGAYKSRKPTSMLHGNYLLDKTSRNEVDSLVSRVQPDVVIDTAALHNVDYCETHAEEAMLVNRDGARNLARASERVGAKFIFISTDFVFNGISAPYSEDARPDPQSVYAKSKLEGEKATLSENPNSAVCRPAVIYSWVAPSVSASSSSGKPLNFGAWLVSQLASRKQVKIVKDQITSPTLADDLAGAILAIAKSTSKGILHTAGATSVSRYEFSVKVAEKLDLDEKLIYPIFSSELKQVAKRPINSTLISNRMKKEIGYEMMPLGRALDLFALQARKELKLV